VAAGNNTYCAVKDSAIHFARRVPIEAATGLHEVVLCAPSPYWDIIYEACVKAQKARRQHARVCAQLKALEQAKLTGKPPTYLNMKPPSYQAIKSFVATHVKQGIDNPFDEAHQTYQTAILDRAINLKRKECAWLMAECYLCVEDTNAMVKVEGDRK